MTAITSLPPTSDNPLFDKATMELLATAIAEDGYGIFPHLLSADVQQGLIELMVAKEAEDEFVAAGVGRGQETKVNSEIRNDSIIWLDDDSSSAIAHTYINGMHRLCEFFREFLFLSVFTYEGHLARYPAAGFYKPHLDRHEKTLAREISIISYLNTDWDESDGGQLRLFTDPSLGVNGPHIDVSPQAGTVVIFRSATFWHEVLPSKKTRLSLTGWLRGRD
ncbi:2OG-Fe(II) oxygenase [Akkermansiaceae bacterium]|nr:2OG-Fe(II) oxygenase [Akkermansiaceae bacterium]